MKRERALQVVLMLVGLFYCFWGYLLFDDLWHSRWLSGHSDVMPMFLSLNTALGVCLLVAVFVADHLRPAAKAAGLGIPDGYRFGLHNLRHSLSSWLVNKGKADPKTVQSLLRHSRIQTTLDLYTQGDGDETRAAQGAFLREMGLASEFVQ